jgi:hypothetical protein
MSLFSCWWLPDVSVSQTKAGRHADAACELITSCVFLSPGVLSQVQLQETGSGPVHPTQTLSLTCAVSGSSTCRGYWIHHLPRKGLESIVQICIVGDMIYVLSLKSWVTMTVDKTKNQFSLSQGSVNSKGMAVYSCIRHAMRGIHHDSSNKHHCKEQDSCATGVTQGS